MYNLMVAFYDNMDIKVFNKDLSEKEWAIVLRNEINTIVGFTTIMIITIIGFKFVGI